MNILKPRRSGSSRRRHGSDEQSVSREDSMQSAGSTGSSAPKKIGRKTWVKDKDSKRCLRCGKKFGLRSRKHHCRRCGYLCCGECTKHRVTFESGKRARICKVCFDLIGPTHMRSSSADKHPFDGHYSTDDKTGTAGDATETGGISHPLAGPIISTDDMDSSTQHRMYDDQSSSSESDNDDDIVETGFSKILHGFGAVSYGTKNTSDSKPSSIAKSSSTTDGSSTAGLSSPTMSSDAETTPVARKKKSGSVFSGIFGGSGGGGNVVTEPLLNETGGNSDMRNDLGSGKDRSNQKKKRDDLNSTKDGSTSGVTQNREHRGISESEDDYDPNDPYYKSNSGCCQSCLIM